MRRVLPWIIVTVVLILSWPTFACPSIPEGLLSLPDDAEVLDVRENPANKGLEVSVVSNYGVEALRDLYVEALQGAQESRVLTVPGGYMITATVSGVDYNIMLSSTAMDPNPKYAGKSSIYAVLTGIESSLDTPDEPPAGGLAWPAHELPGVPRLRGQIHKILVEGGSVYLEITVENSDVVKAYIEDVREAGFSFDSEPTFIDGHVEFFAFRGENILGFGYGEDDNFVAMEYVK